MSETPLGSDWWKASDGKWYPPTQVIGGSSGPELGFQGSAVPPGQIYPPPASWPGYAPYYPAMGGIPYGRPGSSMPVWAVVLIVGGVGFLIMAILLAIAIPTFLSVTSDASNQAAQDNLTTALNAALNSYSVEHRFTPDIVTVLNRIEPNLTFRNGPSINAGEISVANGSQSITLADRSRTGTCWFTRATEQGNGIPTIVHGRSVGPTCSAKLPPPDWSPGFPSSN